jgi:tartrate-resistant acid phosphatase type 5
MRSVACILTSLVALAAPAAPVRFAIIGDFGNGSPEEAAVATRLKTYAPEFVVTLGDNNYLGPTVANFDAAVGRDYRAFIKYPPNSTSQYKDQGSGSINFYPVVGNHDWDNGINTHTSYYTFPSSSSGNSRYYDFARGPVRFFMLDNDGREPDGNAADSAQATWLRNRLAATGERWKLVLAHNPPYSSKGGYTEARWPYKTWGATHVLAGHRHNYERLEVGGLTYFVNGIGGEDIHTGAIPIAESRKLYDDDYGFMLVNADDDSIDLRFITRAGVTIDSMIQGDESLAPIVPEPGGLSVLLLAGHLARRPARVAAHPRCIPV